VFALAGCDQGRQTPAKVAVRVANAAPSFVELGFQREQDINNIASLPFKEATQFAYDVDTYDFFVIERSFPNTAGRTWTFAPTLEAGNGYTVVLTEVAGEIEPVVLMHTPPPAADAQVEALHAANGLPAMDLYLEAPGAGIAGATPRGTFAAGQQLTARTLPTGEYEIWLTEAGNPANVLLATVAITLPAATTSTIVVIPEGNQGTAQISALVLAGTSAVLYDRNATTEFRVINAATDRAPRDFAVNGVFSPPVFSAIPFGEPTAYVEAPVVGTMPINVTPVGNPGVLELDQPFAGFAAGRATIIFGGTAGTLTHTAITDDGRRFGIEAKLRFFNGASQFTTGLDLAIGNPGDDPSTLFPLASLAGPASASGYIPLGPGDYDLYFRQTGTVTVVSGPTRVSLAAGGIYGVLAADGPDTATAEMILLDDFP
jgi:hypothetical protein